MAYVVKKNGRTVAIVEADSMEAVKSDDGKTTNLVFTKDGLEGTLVEENVGDGTPYYNVDWALPQ